MSEEFERNSKVARHAFSVYSLDYTDGDWVDTVLAGWSDAHSRKEGLTDDLQGRVVGAALTQIVVCNRLGLRRLRRLTYGGTSTGRISGRLPVFQQPPRLNP